MECCFLLYLIFLLFFSHWLYFHFLFGFLGNHPFSTLFSCSIISWILHSSVNPKTPINAESIRLFTNKDIIIDNIPPIKNIG